MRIFCISDIHGQTSKIPPCDVLLIAGDLVNSMTDPEQGDNYNWLDIEFRYWLETIPAQHILAIAGNHDFLFEAGRQPADLPMTYLQDSGIEIDGVKFWGTPWQPPFGGWAFNAQDEYQRKQFARIPDDTNVIISHSPPFGYGDGIPRRGVGGLEHVGSKPLKQVVSRLDHLQLVVCGHIHAAYGKHVIHRNNMSDVAVYNAALVNSQYHIVNDGIMYEIDTDSPS